MTEHSMTLSLIVPQLRDRQWISLQGWAGLSSQVAGTNVRSSVRPRMLSVTTGSATANCRRRLSDFLG